MNREQIENLVEYVMANVGVTMEHSIIKFFEQNPMEPIVVGLSDSQVDDLSEALLRNSYFDVAGRATHKKVVSDWIKAQAFAQPEIKKVAVGLSDEQVSELGDVICDNYNKLDSNYLVIKNWLKTQTFAQPQQFEPSWNDSPEWANWLAHDESGQWCWYETKPKEAMGYFATNERSGIIFLKNPNWNHSLQQRPKPPAPTVEVGQVWKYKDYNYTISSVGRLKIADAWLESVCYKTDSGIFYTRTLSDFLAKFECVGGSE